MTEAIISPTYNAKNFEEFCQAQKDKGLDRKFWSELPQMWEEELKFRAELETALINFITSK